MSDTTVYEIKAAHRLLTLVVPYKAASVLTIGAILEPLSRFVDTFWLYIDDLLIAYPDPCFF